MPQLIEAGHLYIAQPPLYKVTRGKSETYLKDERALEDYLIRAGLNDCVLKLASGESRGGNDLRDIIEQARSVAAVLDGLHSRYSRAVVTQAAIAGALVPSSPAERARAEAAAARTAEGLNAVAEETERGWQGHVMADGGLVFTREVRGVKEVHTLDRTFLGSADARKLNDKTAHLAEIYGRPPRLAHKESEQQVSGPIDLLDTVFAIGRKGLSLQRYKGLGEMNPEQLWETTLDRDVRTLLQVKIGDVSEVDEIFSKLMGDVVEPRREFIQENALTVANLDV